MESLLQTLTGAGGGRGGSLIATDALDAALVGLIKTVQRQAREIAELKVALSSADKQSTVAARLAALEEALAELRRDTAVLLPAAAAAHGGGSVDESLDAASLPSARASVPAGALLAAHHEALRGIEAKLARALTADTFEARVAAASRELAQGFASKDGLRQLQGAQEALAESVAALQGLTAAKADRGDILRLGAAAAELTAFAGWKVDAAAALEELRASAADSRAGLDRCLDSLARLSGVVGTLSSAVAGKGDAGEQRALAASVEALRAAVEGEREAARRAAADAAARLSALDSQARSLTAAAEAAARDRAALAAAVGELRGDLAVVRSAVEGAAPAASLAAAASDVAGLRGTVAELARKADVALRFVEWYAAQGPAYEAASAAGLPPPPLERTLLGVNGGGWAQQQQQQSFASSAAAGAQSAPQPQPPSGIPQPAAYQLNATTGSSRGPQRVPLAAGGGHGE